MNDSNMSVQGTDRYKDYMGIATSIKIWLVAGLVMIFFQIILGGITRLTGSGLSITKWEIVVGVVPPLNQAQWEVAFDQYKMTPQYKMINQGMALQDFKFIYFWEYVHRLWGRLMGIIFLIPFLFFWQKKMLSKSLLKDLTIVFILAALVASFGWIMVASGLIDKPWVNAYKLTLHLSFAVLCFAYLLWTTFKVIFPGEKVFHSALLKRSGMVLTFMIFFQIILGGVMAGIKAGPFYPTWPDMNQEIIPSVLFDPSVWNVDNFVNYERSSFLPAFIQSLHRGVAYILIIFSLGYFYYAFYLEKKRLFRIALYLLISLLLMQVLLGILTVINSLGSPPLVLGVAHQAVAILLLGSALFLNFQVDKKHI